ncbi:MAG TPA: hypothetical protein VIV60_04600, partial [Polyangiaceae bacterium]
QRGSLRQGNHPGQAIIYHQQSAIICSMISSKHPIPMRSCARLLRAARLMLVAWLLCGSHAHADATDDARNLFREARQLLTEGQVQAACHRFERSLQLESGSGTEFNLADCWERLGRTASARELFLKVSSDSKRQGQTERAEVAQARADGLLTRLSRLQIQCESGCPSDIHVWRGGSELIRDSWLEPQEVDPSTYRIEAEHGSWRTQLVIPSDPGTVVVSIPAASTEHGATSDAVRPASRVDAVPLLLTHETVRLTTHSLSTRAPRTSSAFAPATKVLFWVGVGALAVGGGSAFLLAYKNEQSRQICPSSENCSDWEIQRHDELVHQAKWSRTAFYVSTGLGIVALSSAVIVNYVAKPRHGERDLSTVAFEVAPVGTGLGSWSATARGSF